MPRTKVSIFNELKPILEAIVANIGVSLSRLLIDADVETHLHRRPPAQTGLNKLCERLAALERAMRKLNRDTLTQKRPEPCKAPRQDMLWTDCLEKGAETFFKGSKPVIESTR